MCYNREPTTDVRARLALAAGLPEYPGDAGITVTEWQTPNGRGNFVRNYNVAVARACPAGAAWRQQWLTAR